MTRTLEGLRTEEYTEEAPKALEAEFEALLPEIPPCRHEENKQWHP